MPDVARLVLRSVVVRFGGVRALDEVDLVAHDAQALGVIGPNGAGKTTSINVMSGFVRPSQGSVELGGEDVTRMAPALRARRGLGRTFQHPPEFAGLTLRQVLAVVRGRGPAPVDEILERVGLEAVADAPWERLTTGQRRFADIARALSLAPSVVLLDEPATGLRDDEVGAIGRLIAGMCAEGTAVIVISHDMRIIHDHCEQVAVLDQGRVVRTGTPEQIRRDPEVIRAYFGEAEVA